MGSAGWQIGRVWSRALLTVAVPVAATGLVPSSGLAAAAPWGPFANPQIVTISGYPGSAEEPFITPDGRYLLFNSSEAQPDFSLQYASRVNAQTFEYEGEILGEGVNEPGSLSGTPTLDEQGDLYFISTRSYFQTLSTVYGGRFSAGRVTGVHLVPGVSGETLGKVDFDVDVSPDGSTLYVSVGQFGALGGPTSASIETFDKQGESFVADPNSASALKAVNEVAPLDYAADVSADGLELFFTAANPAAGEAPGIFRASRSSTTQPFGQVERIAAITGFAEAPSLSADGTTLYYHEMVASEVKVQTVTRSRAPVPSITRLAPKKGPTTGGTSVTISGTNLADVTSVKFGTSTAVFKVNSETSLTAFAPPGPKGTANVTVATPYATSAITAKDRFAYKKAKA